MAYCYLVDKKVLLTVLNYTPQALLRTILAGYASILSFLVIALANKEALLPRTLSVIITFARVSLIYSNVPLKSA